MGRHEFALLGRHFVLLFLDILMAHYFRVFRRQHIISLITMLGQIPRKMIDSCFVGSVTISDSDDEFGIEQI